MRSSAFSTPRRAVPFFAVAAGLLVGCGGCFDRTRPREEVVARGEGEAAEMRGRVTFLDLHGEGEPGRFPEGLGSYPALRRLSLRGRAVDAVPESLGEASGLEELDLAATGVRALPSALGRLPRLRTLYLSDNALETLPAEVCGATALTYLNLDRNRLSALPPEVGRLSSLKWVRLNGNALRDLPAEAGSGWKDVRRLYLRGNGLEAVPEAILSMTSLEELDLGDNALAELPEALFRLPNLHRLDLDGNARLTALPANVADAKKLSHLFLFGCPLPVAERDRIQRELPDRIRQFVAF